VRQPLLPVDETDQDPQFAAFRRAFMQALIARDATVVLQAMLPDVQSRLSALALPREHFGGRGLHADWERLEELLALGGTFTTTRGAEVGRREFCAPYIYSAYPRPVPWDLADELDPWVIISPKAAVRAQPHESAAVLMWLSYELVKMSGDARDPEWYGVIGYDGREGWVASADIRDAADYHACFGQIDGRWLMTAFERGLPP
jgi:hypothetical protein